MKLDFNCRHAFSGGFNLDVEFHTEAPITALFGPSGSGKTSVLRLIAGFFRPREGTIRLCDRPLLDTHNGLFLKPEQRHIGFVFQDHLLFPHLSVEENLRFGQRRRKSRHGVEFADVVEILELGNLLARPPRLLSGGESQRVALGRALLSEPQLLLMDEPLASLDRALQERILSYMETVVKTWNIPILFVSHDPAIVRRMSQWTVLIEHGKVFASSSSKEMWGQE